MRILTTVVTFNRKVLLKENLEALLLQDYKDFDICVIDNKSTDGTYEFIKDIVDENGILYINTGENLGGAGGFNFAMKEAVKRGYDYVWIMDDDTIPTPTALSEFVNGAASLEGEWGYIAGQVNWTDGTQCTMNEQKLIGDEKVGNMSRCRQTSFVSMFIPIVIIKKIGLPIKEFFIWGDDVEYSRRISAKYPSYYLPTAIVVHKTASNSGSNIARDSEERISRYFYAYRNEVYIARHEGFKRKVYQFFKVNYHVVRVLFTAKSKRMLRIKTIIKSSFEGRKFNPSIEYVEVDK